MPRVLGGFGTAIVSTSQGLMTDQNARQKNIGGEIFQIATSKETSLLELLKEIRNIFNTMGLLKVNYIHKDKRVGDVQRNYSDNSKARKVLLWKPKVSLKNGLIKTIKYFHGKV